MYNAPLAVQCIYGLSAGGSEDGDGKERRKIPGGWERGRLLGLLSADDLVLCDEWEDNLRAMVGRFPEACKRKGLRVNAGKRKMMVLNGEDGLENRFM